MNLSTGFLVHQRNGVLLSGFFGCGNFGDDLLLGVVLGRLREIGAGRRVFVRDGGLLVSDSRATGLDAILADRTRWRGARLVHWVLALICILQQCEWLVFAGGGVFHRESIVLQWVLCRLARLMGVRIAAIGVGVGAMGSRREQWMLGDILGMSELFCVRDALSLRRCIAVRAAAPAQLTEDLAFAV